MNQYYIHIFLIFSVHFSDTILWFFTLRMIKKQMIYITTFIPN